MKPAPFDYVRADSVDHALAVLAEHGDEAKVLAGGQSLLPLMNFRFAVPSVLVDIGALADLATVTSAPDQLSVGAMVRHRVLETTALDGPAGVLFRNAGRWIGHLPIRLRGTVGGSLAHADPASEWCTVMHALDARVVLAATGGVRTVPVEEFVDGFLTTVARPDELLVGVEIPRPDPAMHAGFAEYSRRSGDFALALAAVMLHHEAGAVRSARVSVGGSADGPMRATAAEACLLAAGRVDDAVIDEAAHLATADLALADTPTISAAGRRRLARACVARALRDALGAHAAAVAA